MQLEGINLTAWGSVAKDTRTGRKRRERFARCCTDVTVMGCPAISVPAGFTDDGLPVGVQLVGPPRNDVDLLRMAAAYEAATGHWRTAPRI